MTQEQLAERTGISLGGLSQAEAPNYGYGGFPDYSVFIS